MCFRLYINLIFYKGWSRFLSICKSYLVYNVFIFAGRIAGFFLRGRARIYHGSGEGLLVSIHTAAVGRYALSLRSIIAYNIIFIVNRDVLLLSSLFKCHLLIRKINVLFLIKNTKYHLVFPEN